MVELFLVYLKDKKSLCTTETISLCESLGFDKIHHVRLSKESFSTAEVFFKLYEEIGACRPNTICLVVNAEKCIPVQPAKRFLYKFSSLGYGLIFSADFIPSYWVGLPDLCTEVFERGVYRNPVFNGFICDAKAFLDFFHIYGLSYNKKETPLKEALFFSLASALNANCEFVTLDCRGIFFFPGISAKSHIFLQKIEKEPYIDTCACSCPGVLCTRFSYPEVVTLCPEESDYYFLDEVGIALEQKDHLNPYKKNKLRYAGRTLLTAEKCSILSRIASFLSTKEGDVVEVGCYRGGGSKILRDNIEKGEMFSFDTFEGLTGVTELDQTANLREGLYNDADYEDVKKYLEGIHVIRGKFPDSKPRGFKKRKIKVAHIDVNVYESTLNTFKTIYPLMSSGGVLVLDDMDLPGVKKAIDEYFLPKRINPFRPLDLDYGFVLKDEKNKKL